MTTSLLRLSGQLSPASSKQPDRELPLSGERRTVSQLAVNRLNCSTVCFDQASLPKHLEGASDKRCSEKALAACPAAAEEFEQGRGDGWGWGKRDFQWREGGSRKISEI